MVTLSQKLVIRRKSPFIKKTLSFNGEKMLRPLSKYDKINFVGKLRTRLSVDCTLEITSSIC